jgi:hypothetical protein
MQCLRSCRYVAHIHSLLSSISKRLHHGLQKPANKYVAGKVTAMEICNGMLCLACHSAEMPLIVLRLDDLSKARPVPLREGKSVSQWISGILGTAQPPLVACMVNVPVPGASHVLAVLYTSGLLSVWEPNTGRHLCQMAVGAAADLQQEGPAQPFTVSGLCVPISSLPDAPLEHCFDRDAYVEHVCCSSKDHFRVCWFGASTVTSVSDVYV